MKQISPATHPLTSAISSPFDKTWKQISKDDDIPCLLRYGIFRFFLAIAALIVFPVYIYINTTFVVVSNPLPFTIKNKTAKTLPPPTSRGPQALPDGVVTQPITIERKDVGLPNFSSSETSNVCYMNAAMQMMHNLPFLNEKIRRSLAEEQRTFNEEGGAKPFNLELKAAVVVLLDQMADGNSQGITEAHQNLALTYLSSDDWKRAFNGEEAGTMQGSMHFFRFVCSRLNIDESIFMIATLHTNIKLQDPNTGEPIPGGRVIHPRGSIPLLNISPTGSVQDAINNIEQEEHEDLGITMIRPEEHGDIEVSAKQVLLSLAAKLLDERGRGLLRDILNSHPGSAFETVGPAQAAALNLFNIASLDDAQEIFIHKIAPGNQLARKIKTEHQTVDRRTPRLMLEIQHTTVNGHLERANDTFIPEDVIVVNGQRYGLKGAINRPNSNHYTYLRRNAKDWTYFNDASVTNIRKLDDTHFLGGAKIEGQGRALRTLIYELI